ncbi:MAG: imidazole glycerol phosphate synthase subunit HisF [Crocinitomicaceae bacterium]|nr:imidazole glycerol phosphate synthase subunit HisF [Crocinitomicaceae bacterium]|tara:strand:+ start:19090 stop:19848 length:759 start_codon:yes stop_codon:yes gene_type:complete
MIRKRIIPVLLLKNNGLYKGVGYDKYVYIGDPINAVKIFNDMEVDELIFLDIEASKKNKVISQRFVEKLSEECFMPFSVGGGIKSLEDAKKLISAGAEKIVLNNWAVNRPEIITEISNSFGSQSIVVAVDVKKNWLGKEKVYRFSGERPTKLNLEEWVMEIEKRGAGEILINSIELDGKMNGYNTDLINRVSKSVNIPVIAGCGAGVVSHFKDAFKAGAEACAGGSVFVFHGARKGVLINYPSKEELENIYN